MPLNSSAALCARGPYALRLSPLALVKAPALEGLRELLR